MATGGDGVGVGVTEDFIQELYPLHKLVWENKAKELEERLKGGGVEVVEEIEKLDPRGRTPLLLAVVLGHTEIAEVLLKNNASAQFEHQNGWNVLHEATCRADPDLLRLVLEYKDGQKQSKRSNMIPEVLRRLADAPDFYVEIKFELSSWMPFIAGMMPGNVHRIYKMGSKVRVDSCILDGETPDWANAVTLIFHGQDDHVQMLEIYHSSQQGLATIILSGKHDVVVPESRLYERAISHRLSRPAMIAYVDLDKIEFERNKTVWGWGSDKTEEVNGYECKVFSASNVEFVTKVRTEHLSESDKNEVANNSKNQAKSQVHRILNSFGSVETTETTQGASAAALGATSFSHDEIRMEQYFDTSFDLLGRDIGRSKEIRTKVNKFKAQVWLCEDYPVNLQEQIMPIIDIMALSNTMFNKLKQFIQMQIPAGFPVKIEIPFFHLVNANVTFHNIFASERSVAGVSCIGEDSSSRVSCVLEDDLFQPPTHYHIKTVSNLNPLTPSDDDLFSWTLPDDPEDFYDVQNRENKKVDIYEALNAPRVYKEAVPTPDSDTEEQLLQRAIEESLMMARMQERPDWKPSPSTHRGIVPSVSISSSQEDQDSFAEVGQGSSGISGASALPRSNSFEELQAVLDLSRREVEEDNRLRQEEEEALRKVLELSLKEM